MGSSSARHCHPLSISTLPTHQDCGTIVCIERQLDTLPVANEKLPPPRNDAEVTYKNKTLAWSDKLRALFHTLRRYYPGYAAFEYGIEWMSPAAKETSMNVAALDDKSRSNE